MRLIARIKNDNLRIRRLMIYASIEGVYLFEYDSEKDSSAVSDYWFASIEDAYESSLEDYGIAKTDWVEIPDPSEGSQHDWIANVRVKGRDVGSPEWGKFEQLIDGKWISID